MANKTLRLALIGFGTVGQGLAEILQSNADSLAAKNDFQVVIVEVSNLMKVSVYCPYGLDIGLLLQAGKAGNLAAYPNQPGLNSRPCLLAKADQYPGRKGNKLNLSSGPTLPRSPLESHFSPLTNQHWIAKSRPALAQLSQSRSMPAAAFCSPSVAPKISVEYSLKHTHLHGY